VSISNGSIKAKIIIVVILVVVTNIIIGLSGLNNLRNVQTSLEESLEVRATNLNLLRTAGIDIHQMYLAETGLYRYIPDFEDFKKTDGRI